MPVNHFIISLGGTGARVLRAFRKRNFSEFRARATDPAAKYRYLDSIDDKVFLQCLMVDTSAALFNKADSWRVLGTSVKPQDANWLHLRQNINVTDWIRNSRQYPGVAEWIGSQEVWREVPEGVLSGDAGGQRRRLGRLLFAASAERFRAKVVELNDALTRRSSQQGTTFHIVCGLSGGTGSGCVVDAIAQVSRLATHPSDRIMVYAVLPERAPLAGKAETYYHANAYAALREINGLLIGAYQPWDVLHGTGKIAIGDKLRSVYLISNENENGYLVHMDDDSDVSGGLSEIVGDFMFQKLVTDPLSGRAATPMETAENTADLAELSAGRAARSRKFLTFGIRRVAVPEEEIQEYFTLSFASRGANHMRFNNWSELDGWRGEPVARNYHEEVRKPEALMRWKLTDGHLLYELPVLPADSSRGWRSTIDMEWDEWAADAVGQVRDAFPANEWLDQVNQQFAAEYDRGYRGQGVPDFYATRIASARTIAQEIRSVVERDLFQAWRNGIYSLADLVQLVAALRSQVEARVKRILGQVPELRDAEQSAAQSLQSVRDRWTRLWTPIGRGSLFDEMRANCLSYQQLATAIAAADYVERSSPLIIRELTALETVIQGAEQRLSQATEKLDAAVNARLTSSNKAVGAHMERIIDSDAVRATIKNEFLLNKDVQFRLAQSVREALIGERALGDAPSFQKFSERWPEGELVSELEMICETAASRAHDAANLEESRRFLGVSLLKKLRQDYGGRLEELTGFTRASMQAAGPFLRLNPAEVQAGGPEYGLDPTVAREPPRGVLIHCPSAPDMPDFVQLIETRFRDVHTGGPFMFNAVGHKQSEITIVTVLSAFPARYVALLTLIRDAYWSLVNDERQARRVRMELHTSDVCLELPDLLPEIGPPPDVSSYLILAEILGVVTQTRSVVTGRNQVLLHTTDGDGLPTTIPLGATMEQAKSELHGRAAAAIRDELNTKLRERVHEDEKESLRASLRSRLTIVMDRVGGDPQHPEYLEEHSAIGRAVKLIAVGRV